MTNQNITFRQLQGSSFWFIYSPNLSLCMYINRLSLLFWLTVLRLWGHRTHSCLRLVLCKLSFEECQNWKALQVKRKWMRSIVPTFNWPHQSYIEGNLTRGSRRASSDFNVKDSNNFMASWNPSTAVSSSPRVLSTSATFERDTAISRICNTKTTRHKQCRTSQGQHKHWNRRNSNVSPELQCISIANPPVKTKAKNKNT